MFHENIFSVRTHLVSSFDINYLRPGPGQYHPLDAVAHPLQITPLKNSLPYHLCSRSLRRLARRRILLLPPTPMFFAADADGRPTRPFAVPPPPSGYGGVGDDVINKLPL